MISLQSAALGAGVIGTIGMFVWALERDRKQQHRMGICPREWESKEARVKANMDGFYKRAERKLFGVRSSIEKRLQRSE